MDRCILSFIKRLSVFDGRLWVCEVDMSVLSVKT